jgi:hypothetical protein
MKNPHRIHEIHVLVPDKLYEQFKHVSYTEGFSMQKLARILLEQYVEEYYKPKRNII